MFMLTLASNAKGGTPVGPPVERNDNVELVAVVLNVMVCIIQATNPWLVLLTVAVDSD